MDFTEMPKRQNKVAAVSLAVYLSLSSLCLLSRAFRITESVAIDALFLVFSVAAIFVMTNSFLTDYEYRLFSAQGKHFFAVSKIQGKRKTMLVAIELSDVLKLVEEKEEKTEKRPTVQKKLNYCKTLMPNRYQIIYFTNGSDNISLRVELTESSFFALSERVMRAKAEKLRDLDGEEADGDNVNGDEK